MFYFDEINGKKILKSDFLTGTKHFFTTREICIKTKEPDLEKVAEDNRRIVCEYLNIYTKDLITPSQTHSANVGIAKAGTDNYPETDGLILTNNKQAVFLNFADCTPIIFYDEKQNIGAVTHAGWRGTAQKIAALTVEKMQSEFNSKPENIIAVIGPAVSICCYNVGEDVFEKLKSTVSVYENLFEERNGELFVDLKGINRQQLIECGVKKIDVCPYCTVCDNDMFFSYRKENGTTSRHSAVLKLN